jgi:glutamyl-tRNA reductase
LGSKSDIVDERSENKLEKINEYKIDDLWVMENKNRNVIQTENKDNKLIIYLQTEKYRYL